MKIKRWFQGPIACVDGVIRDVRRGAAVEDPEHGSGLMQCLYTAVITHNGDSLALARIADRLFGHRCLCAPGNPIMRLVHINNALETTREDVNKVLQVYTEEVEAAGG